VLPLHDDRPATYAAAIEAYLTAVGIAASSRRIYRISLTTWAWLARGEQPPLGAQRRIAVVSGLVLAAFDQPDTRRC
jgi:hypothetical protein